ncbi:hypothetical protein LRM64_24140 [Prescottella equi]|nr:hypothetical protein [Prescottella equi]MCU7531962.1 hypothetical protein [Prescottella equi]MCU7536776.1 hypothetical protein [Prescottella equi]
MAVHALAEWPIPPTSAPSVLEVCKQPKMFRIYAPSLLTGVIHGHAFGDLAVDRHPGRSMGRRSATPVGVMPSDLRITVRGCRVPADVAAVRIDINIVERSLGDAIWNCRDRNSH